jgi:hypothetical protein
LTKDIAGGEELKEVIDDALEGFQMLISESFKPPAGKEREASNKKPQRKKDWSQNP